MISAVRERAERAYERLLLRELSEMPSHVAVIMDGNRRYASRRGGDATDGHRAGAETTENLLDWCDELGIEEVTLYAFSTENFERPADQKAELFDLIEEKLRTFADADRVRDAVAYADRRTREYDRLHLNVALAYGGRRELLEAARSVARSVEAGECDPSEIDVETIDDALYDGPTRDVDLILRSGGDERTSNFLPWQANGNEAAVYFCAPYWPEFRKIDFLRGVRTYENRRERWQRTRAERALALLRAHGEAELEEAREVLGRFRHRLPSSATNQIPTEVVEPDEVQADDVEPSAD